MFNLLKLILIMLEKQYVEQLNSANGYPPSQIMNSSDVDLINKVLDMYSSQFKSIINKHCGKLFDECYDSQCKQINITLVNGKTCTLCVIDNVFIKTDELVDVKSVIIRVGKTKGIIKYLNDTDTYGEASVIFQSNINSLDILIKALDNNQKLIIECLRNLENFLKYKSLKLV